MLGMLINYNKKKLKKHSLLKINHLEFKQRENKKREISQGQLKQQMEDRLIEFEWVFVFY